MFTPAGKFRWKEILKQFVKDIKKWIIKRAIRRTFNVNKQS